MPEFNIVWNPETFRSLGIVFSTKIDEIVALNYKNKLIEIRKIFYNWNKRNLTPFGKVVVIKTLAISKLTYLFINLPDPGEDFLKNLNTELFSFLWNGKRDKVKRIAMFQSYDQGGIKMLDVRNFLSALKISCLQRTIDSEGKVAKLLFSTCPQVKNIKIMGSEFANVLMQKTKNPFWFDVFKHYKKMYKKCPPFSFSDFVSECVHYNDNICRQGKVTYIKNWVECGIFSIGHLCNQHGYLSYEEFKETYPNAQVNFILYQGVIAAVKQYQKKCKVEFGEHVVEKPQV